ncbi:ATP-NAD kinase family protein [Alteromonadaceae bacterium BrNp21-10]|nr:ATP-NAD kinase family protein [Alteromonadaceae bacterium BrNp21-10]
MLPMFKLGLIINPWSGIGGAMALKGSDGADIRQQALAQGAIPQANNKMRLALEVLLPLQSKIQLLTAAADMGADLANELGFTTQVIYSQDHIQTEAEDTENAATALMAAGVDVILFAGGDGTARNICQIVGEKIPVIGVPAGCKIHSGVYAVTPKAAGKVVEQLVNGELVSVSEAEVKDIDEQRFREGKVIAKHFGDMLVPSALQYVQATKSGGQESEELVLDDIAAEIIENMDDELYIMGSGSTVAAVMDALGLENTLLGVDVLQHQQLLHSDVTAKQLLNIIQASQQPVKLVITLIGGQGHIFGRGNQQLSPDVIRAIGRDNIIIVATKAKLNALNGRPLITDTGDVELDRQLCGLIRITSGYRDHVLYPLASPGNEQ